MQQPELEHELAAMDVRKNCDFARVASIQAARAASAPRVMATGSFPGQIAEPRRNAAACRKAPENTSASTR